jgi:hypothetical protein
MFPNIFFVFFKEKNLKKREEKKKTSYELVRVKRPFSHLVIVLRKVSPCVWTVGYVNRAEEK